MESNWSQTLAQTGAKSLIATIALVVVVGAAGGATFAFRDKIFKSRREQAEAQTGGAREKRPSCRRRFYPIPTNINWTLDLSEATIPEATAVGSIHASGFYCETRYVARRAFDTSTGTFGTGGSGNYRSAFLRMRAKS